MPVPREFDPSRLATTGTLTLNAAAGDNAGSCGQCYRNRLACEDDRWRAMMTGRWLEAPALRVRMHQSIPESLIINPSSQNPAAPVAEAQF